MKQNFYLSYREETEHKAFSDCSEVGLSLKCIKLPFLTIFK